MIESKNEFLALCKGEDSCDKRRLRTESAKEAVWFELLQEGPDVRASVVMNKSLPPRILEKLARDSEWRIRYAVAEKRRVSSELLDILCRDRNEAVRARAARHRNISRHSLEYLLDDAWPEIRKLAAERLGQD